MIERVFRCDGPDCECHERTAEEQPRAFLTVVEPPGESFHFCTWDCLLKYAAQKPPVESGLLSDLD